jgi:Tol biopolymer transport system component
MRPFLASSAASIAAVLALSSALAAQSTTRISLGTGGAQPNATCYGPSISADGRFVAYESSASNLVVGDTNGYLDVFVYDSQTATTTRVSLGVGGAQSNHQSYEVALSADGRFVAFKSSATNLVVGDTNGGTDIFVHDRQTATTTRVSVNSSGAQASGWSSSPSISQDGRYVAFDSEAPDLVAGDTNGVSDAFVHDRQTGVTKRVSVDSGGAQGDQSSWVPGISADGRFVSYVSDSTNLVPGDGNSQSDIFVHDLVTGATTRVSVDSFGVEGNGYVYWPVLSADGRFCAFLASSSNLVPGDTNFADDIFVHDRQTGTTERVSVDSFGTEADDNCDGPVISADGRFVAYMSYATNLVPGDSNFALDVFLRDRATGVTTRESVDSSGAEGDLDSDSPSLSADGRYVAFDSDASNLVPGDTNNHFDVFVRDRGPAAPIAYCTAGTTSNGCLPSISGSGTPSASAPSGFTISVAAVEGQKQGLIFYGVTGRVALAWGTSSSFLCVKAPTQRTPAQNTGGTAGACNGTLSIDWNAYIAANPGALGTPFSAGARVDAQGWFRDPPSPKTTMLSDALEFDLGP